MNLWMPLYFVCFAILSGAAFAMMWANIKSINVIMERPPQPKHPEAPEPGDEVLYVEVEKDTAAEFRHRKQWLEDMYNK